MALLRRRRELLASLGTRRLHLDIADVLRPGGGRGRPPLEAVQAEADARLLSAGAERVGVHIAWHVHEHAWANPCLEPLPKLQSLPPLQQQTCSGRLANT